MFGKSSRRWALDLQLHKFIQSKCSTKLQKQGFRVQFFTSVSERSCHYCTMIEGRTQRPLCRVRENRQSTCYITSDIKSLLQLKFFPNLHSILSFTRCYERVTITRLLSFSNQIPFYFYLGRSYSIDRYLVCGKRPLAFVVMKGELPPFKNG